MNKTMGFALLFILSQTVAAQILTTITYDSLNGYYLIRYQGAEGPIETIFEPSTNINPAVSVQVSREASPDTFKYSYTVRNSADSRQRLFSFSVEYYSAISNISRPTTQWSAYAFSGRPIVSWTHSLVTPTGVKSRISGIAPDSSLSGFSFRSPGLPGLVKSYSEGLTRTLRFPEEPPEDVDSLLSPIQEFPHNSVQRIVVGPKDLPTTITPIIFLDTLISYKHQARGLGWLKDKRAEKDDNDDDDDDENQTIVQQLDHRLDKARKELVKGDSAKARQELEKFVRRVDGLRQQSVRAEERKKQEQVVLTSEAHALLKFNAEYLIERLPKKKGRTD